MKHILLVDDEDSIRNTFAIFLQRDGHKVSTAENLAAATRLLHTHDFDLVVTDIVLPDDHGLQVLHEVKRLGRHAPVIMITGQPTIDNAAESLRQGAFDYLLKPVKKDDLLRAVNKAIEYKDLLDGKKLLEQENARYRLRLEELVHERTQQLTKTNVQLRREVDEREQAEASLRQHQERLALAMEISGAAAFESRPAEGVFICNERLAEITGAPLEELKQFHHDYHRWLDRFHEDDREHFHKVLAGLVTGERQFVDEVVRLQREDGDCIFLHGLARAVEHDADGRASRIVGVIMDITHQMRANEFFRQQRDLGLALSQAASQQQAAAITMDALLQQTGMEIFSFYAMEPKGQAISCIYSKGLPQEIVDAISSYDSSSPQYKFLRAGEPLFSHYEAMDDMVDPAMGGLGLKAVGIVPLMHESRLVGSLCMASTSMEHLPTESRFRVEAMASQVAGALASLQAQEALRKSEAKYRNLIDTIPHGIVELDRNGAILFCNQVTAGRQGREPEELLGITVDSLMAREEQRTAFREYLNRAYTEELTPEPFSFQVHDQHGNLVDLQADWNWNRDDHGVRGITAVITDVTARNRAERALQKAHEELEHRVEERTRELRETSLQLRRLAARQGEIIEEERKRIAREIHDELGQNLTALNMGLSVLGNMLPQDEPQLQTRINVLRTTLEQMIRAVQRICQELRPMQLDDLGLGAAMAWRIRDFQEASGVRTVLNLEREDIEVEPELGMAVYRLVQEALTNAARHASATHIEVSLRLEEGQLKVVVQDDGTGIDPAVLTSQDSFGLLGMRERMHAVGGSLSIHGEKGKGTTVMATFPLAATNEGAKQD